MSEYKIGSEWRRWDLHIHSNASDGNGTPAEIVEEAIRKGISVIALTDHHTVKNIDAIKEYAKNKAIHIISGIEFRTEYGEKSVHIIGLFPDIHNGITLNAKALNELILSPLGLSETNIIAKGREGDPTLSEEKAFKKGMFKVQVDFKTAANIIRKYGGIVTVHAGDKHGSIEEMKHEGKSPRNVSDIADSLGPVKEEILKKYVDICEMSSLDEKNANFYLKAFGRCTIVASDAHDFNKTGECYTWIKADPNLNGLFHASLEPDRIFVGEIPPAIDRLQKNKTKTLERLTIAWEDAYTGANGEWFNDVDIMINPEMTAVIGNKGSGKTAIAEIIALLSNCKNSDDFVFLNKTKFKNKRLASNFKAKLSWHNNVMERSKNLNDDPDITAEEVIHFVPQRSFESFCNDSDEKFEEEINKVVFSRMPAEERLGFSSFKDLLDNKKKVIVKVQ
ncbi:PHP domain-containing protein [Pygmaiobacter massiliensis]|uniref:PHP domain-containing protein n=1 Tax=Pygmaiobacter massiliensis TaxID=1917873 RepID=UPI00289E1DC7|nr:PHP domain-containing protein [Pygmaiobacter massiliensis]